LPSLSARPDQQLDLEGGVSLHAPTGKLGLQLLWVINKPMGVIHESKKMLTRRVRVVALNINHQFVRKIASMRLITDAFDLNENLDTRKNNIHALGTSSKLRSWILQPSIIE